MLSYPALLRMGFTGTPSVTRRPVSSYLTFPPLPDESGGIFLLHFPWSHLHRTLSGILPCEARTFLTASLSSETARSFIGLAFLIVSKFFFKVKFFPRRILRLYPDRWQPAYHHIHTHNRWQYDHSFDRFLISHDRKSSLSVYGL